MIWGDRDTFVRFLADRLATAVGSPSASYEGSLRYTNTRDRTRDLEYDANRWRRFIYLAAYRPDYFYYQLDTTTRHGKPPPTGNKRLGFYPWPYISALFRRDAYLKAQSLRTARPSLYSHPLWHEYRIPKPNHPDRIIHIPHPALRLVHLEIMSLVSTAMASQFHEASFGMRSGTGGIRAHAQRHVDARFVAQFDLANCFPSITLSHLLRALSGRRVAHPTPQDVSVSTDVAVCLALLCTRRRRLVQGASSSPLLADLVLSAVDRRIEQKLEEDLHGAIYSRYFDDLCISLSGKVAHKKRVDFRRFKHMAAQSVRDAVAELTLAINPRKSCFTDLRQANHVTITGITLQSKRSVLPRAARRRLRAMAHALKLKGLPHLLPQSDGLIRSDPPGSTEFDVFNWDSVWQTVRAHRNLLARHRASVGSSPFRSDSSKSWRPLSDRFSQRADERSQRSRARSDLPPVRRDRVPAHWLAVRLTITPDSGSTSQYEDYVGRTAWTLLKQVVSRLASNTAAIRKCTEQGGLIIDFVDDNKIRGTLGIRDSLGVVPKVLAVPPQSLLPLTLSLRSLHGFLSHCLFVASAVGTAEVSPKEILEVISQLESVWRRAPLPLPELQHSELVAPQHTASGDEMFEARMMTEDERAKHNARQHHAKLAKDSWTSIMRSKQLVTHDFRHHREGWTTALLAGTNDSGWFEAIDVLIQSNWPEAASSTKTLAEPMPPSLARSCRIMSDRKRRLRLAHYTLRPNGRDSVTTRSSLTQQQELVYEQAQLLDRPHTEIRFTTSDQLDGEGLLALLESSVRAVESQGGFREDTVAASAPQFREVRKCLAESNLEATDRLPAIAMALSQLTIEQIAQSPQPSGKTPDQHENDCRNQFFRQMAPGKSRVFETIRALRNRRGHRSDVGTFVENHRDQAIPAEKAIRRLRSNCLALIGAFDSWKGLPDSHEHVLEHMMSPLEGREAAHELVRQVVEALESWKLTAKSAHSDLP